MIDDDYRRGASPPARNVPLALVPETRPILEESRNSSNPYGLLIKSAMQEKLAKNAQCEPFTGDRRDLPLFQKAWRAYLQFLGANEETESNSTLVAMLKQSVDKTSRARWVRREENGEQLVYAQMWEELTMTFGLHNNLFRKPEWLSLKLRYTG